MFKSYPSDCSSILNVLFSVVQFYRLRVFHIIRFSFHRNCSLQLCQESFFLSLFRVGKCLLAQHCTYPPLRLVLFGKDVALVAFFAGKGFVLLRFFGVLGLVLGLGAGVIFFYDTNFIKNIESPLTSCVQFNK